MPRAKRIFLINDTRNFTDKLLLEGLRKKVKGLIRIGHDTQVFSYNTAFWQTNPIVSKLVSRKWCKPHVDELLVKQVKNYNPDIVFVNFANYLNADTIKSIRQVAADAFYIGYDCDLWPELHKGRVAAAKELDLVLTTFEGKGLDVYREAGVHCVFLPNMCDPDIEYRYDVEPEWKSDILFTGKTWYKHKRYPTEDTRYQILSRLAGMKNCTLYNCYGRPAIGGIDYLYAISGSRIGLSINAINDIELYHSDRFTYYLSCGTFVLAKRVPGSERLFQDGVHLRYFDSVEEFFDLADWYLAHEDERIKIADAGMKRAHSEFNCTKMAKYIMDVIETGTYKAPWM
jgi:glycosyltransferase involved in cell wall biosynthesis